jgi:hypothetical protein
MGRSLVHDDPGSSSQNHPTVQRDRAQLNGCTFGGSDAAQRFPIRRDLSPSVSESRAQNLHAAGCCSVRATRVSRRRPTTADPDSRGIYYHRIRKLQRWGNGDTPPWMRPRTTTLERESEKKNVVSELRFRYLKRMNDTRPFGGRRIATCCELQ